MDRGWVGVASEGGLGEKNARLLKLENMWIQQSCCCCHSRKNDNTYFTHKIVVIGKYMNFKKWLQEWQYIMSQECWQLWIFDYQIDQSQDYLMQDISQECWQDCNHKNYGNISSF